MKTFRDVRFLGAMAALMLGGLACSNGSGKGTSSSGGSSSGGLCGAAQSACTVSSECCSNLTCNGGACCAKITVKCSLNTDCCGGLTCDNSGDANSGTCIQSGGTGGDGGAACLLSDAGGPCVTMNDCSPPEVCLDGGAGNYGFCGAAPPAPSAACVPNGNSCTATGSPCCGGSCVNGLCVARGSCSLQGAGCNADGDCCNNLHCVLNPPSGGSSSSSGSSSGGAPTSGGSSSGSSGAASSGGTSSGSSGASSSGSSGGLADAGATSGSSSSGGGSSSGGAAGGSSGGGVTYAGVCQPTCGGQFASCSTANGNADCCSSQGLSCLPTYPDGGGPGLCDYLSANLYNPPVTCVATPNLCGGQPIQVSQNLTNLPCSLGTPCLPDSQGNDPCHSAGFVCDSANSVCRYPSEQDSCVPRGPGCQPLANSTVTDLQCLIPPAPFNGGPGCWQPCSTSSDCINPITTCQHIAGGSVCAYNIAVGNTCNGGAAFYGPCNSAGTGDGYCFPVIQGSGTSNSVTLAICTQVAPDGGGPGSPCADSANRQNPDFCNASAQCLGGVCAANCNAGTGTSGPTCTQPDAGPAEACMATQGESSDSIDQGNCVVNCDFTSASGGGCTTTPDGVPQKCFPQAFFLGTDTPNGLCVAAPEPAAAVPLQGSCPSSSSFLDTCVAGDICLGGNPGTCARLCTNVSSQGQAPCGPGEVCTGFNLGNGTTSRHVGFCQLPDGGV